jgi:RNA polymerase sigma factor (sigma-70 family)
VSAAPDTEAIARAVRRLAIVPDDAEAWAALYAHTRPLVLATARQVANGDVDLAADICQHVFLLLLRNPPFAGVDDPARFPAYLRQMTRREAVELVRRQKSADAVSLDELTTQPLQWDDVRDPLPLATLEAESLLQTALADLNPVDQRLIELLLRDVDLTTIAETLGLTYSATAVRLHRIRRKLRKYLG